MKDRRNPFLKKKKHSSIKYKVIRDIRTLFKPDEDDYYELIRMNNVFDDSIIEYESNVDKDKTLSIEQYLDIKQGMAYLFYYMVATSNKIWEDKF